MRLIKHTSMHHSSFVLVPFAYLINYLSSKIKHMGPFWNLEMTNCFTNIFYFSAYLQIKPFFFLFQFIWRQGLFTHFLYFLCVKNINNLKNLFKLQRTFCAIERIESKKNHAKFQSHIGQMLLFFLFSFGECYFKSCGLLRKGVLLFLKAIRYIIL